MAPKTDQKPDSDTSGTEKTLPGPDGLSEWFDYIWNIPDDPLSGLDRLRSDFGDILQFYNPSMMRQMVMLSRPDYVKSVLYENQNEYRKSDTYEYLKPLLGTGLLTTEGDRWKRDRKLIAHSRTNKQAIRINTR